MELKNVAPVQGKRLTLLLMSTTAEGEDNWAAFAGTVRLEDDATLYLDREDTPSFEIRLSGSNESSPWTRRFGKRCSMPTTTCP